MCSREEMSLDNPEMSSGYAPSMVQWKEILTKATLTGALAGTAAALLVPGGSVSLGGMSVPGSVALGLGAAGGSVAGDLAHKYILPHIPQNAKYEGVESAAISVGAAIGGSYLVMNMMGDVPLMTPILLGGGSYIGADYLNRYVFDSKTGGFVY